MNFLDQVAIANQVFLKLAATYPCLEGENPYAASDFYCGCVNCSFVLAIGKERVRTLTTSTEVTTKEP